MALKIKSEDMERLRTALEAEPVKIFARHRLEQCQKLHQTPGQSFYQRPELWLPAWRWAVLEFVRKSNAPLDQFLGDYRSSELLDAMELLLLIE